MLDYIIQQTYNLNDETYCWSVVWSVVTQRAVCYNSPVAVERYRSGHNGADSKSVWEQSHMGSNPILSATYGVGSNIPAPFSVEKLCSV